MESTPTDRTAQLKIYVRVGALRRFHQLKAKTAGLPVEVLWDRRGGRHDRRPEERRDQPPFTWEAADFVVVEGSSAATPGR